MHDRDDIDHVDYMVNMMSSLLNRDFRVEVLEGGTDLVGFGVRPFNVMQGGMR
jgi:hypothetical protein